MSRGISPLAAQVERRDGGALASPPCVVDVHARFPYTDYSVAVQLCRSSLPSSSFDFEQAKGRLETGAAKVCSHHKFT
jgi:hypothetical protein